MSAPWIVLELLEGCARDLLDDPDLLQSALERAAHDAGEALALARHQFSPHGVTMAMVLAGGHAALHTWPEHGTLFIDLAHHDQSVVERMLTTLRTSFAHTARQSRAPLQLWPASVRETV